jgi:hypothetical protein
MQTWVHTRLLLRRASQNQLNVIIIEIVIDWLKGLHLDRVIYLKVQIRFIGI